MENKECKIVCDDTVMATITCSDQGINIKPSEEGKDMCKNKKCC
tara:strand:+ start:305 stop:436 length:132 start_codon:yes stop_codon:yes gene_type:complete